MTKREKEIFEIIKKDLLDIGNELTPSTLLVVRNLANAHYMAEGLEKEVEEKGSTQYTKNGYGQPAPWFTNLTRVHAIIIRHRTSLGLYKSEKKPLEEPKDEENLFND